MQIIPRPKSGITEFQEALNPYLMLMLQKRLQEQSDIKQEKRDIAKEERERAFKKGETKAEMKFQLGKETRERGFSREQLQSQQVGDLLKAGVLEAFTPEQQALEQQRIAATGTPVVQGPSGGFIGSAQGLAGIDGQTQPLPAPNIPPTIPFGGAQLRAQPSIERELQTAQIANIKSNIQTRERQLILDEKKVDEDIKQNGLTNENQQKKLLLEGQRNQIALANNAISQTELAAKITAAQPGKFLGMGSAPVTPESIQATQQGLFPSTSLPETLPVSKEGKVKTTSRQNAIDFLIENGMPTTEANIKATIKRFKF